MSILLVERNWKFKMWGKRWIIHMHSFQLDAGLKRDTPLFFTLFCFRQSSHAAQAIVMDSWYFDLGLSSVHHRHAPSRAQEEFSESSSAHQCTREINFQQLICEKQPNNYSPWHFVRNHTLNKNNSCTFLVASLIFLPLGILGRAKEISYTQQQLKWVF